MNKRMILVSMVALMSVTGIVAASIPFFGYMKPSVTAGLTLPHIKIDKLNIGEYRIIDSGQRGWLGESWLIIKDHQSRLSVYTIPTKEDKVFLPDIDWFRWGGLCKDFRPELENNLIKPNGTIRCHDKSDYEWGNHEWRWTYNGKNLGDHTSDMIQPRFKVEGSYLIIGKY